MQGNERADRIKRAATQHWAHDPAGALAVAPDALHSPDAFRRVEEYRYREQSWMHSTFHFERFTNHRVLEIGVGLGTDHLQFARAGADMTGIDITARCVALTRLRLKHEGLTSRLSVMDAEALSFADGSFDVVYSFGVLHHTPDPVRAFQEVRRVLRRGGVFIGALYNRRSAFVALMHYQRLVVPEYRHLTLPERLALVEHSTSSSPTRPHVRLFTARELRRLLLGAGFADVTLLKRHAGLKMRRLPKRLERAASRRAGWYLVHEAH